MGNHIDTSKFPRYCCACLDGKSFYASVECVLRGIDPLTSYLVVVGEKSRKGSVVLASTQMMKRTYGIKTGSRNFEIPYHDPRIIVVEARMATYIEFSMEVIRILNQYVPMECIHAYSVDESFITLDHNLYGDKWQTLTAIQNKIRAVLKITVAVGVGNNMLQSKLALDVLAKNNAETGYTAEVNYDNFAEKLWGAEIRDIWGIGAKTEKSLNQMGVFKLGDLAKMPVDFLKRKFGVIGEQLFYHAHGIDLTVPYFKHDLRQNEIAMKGFSSGITLLRDYQGDEVLDAIYCQVEEVTRRARSAKMAGRTVSLSIGYSHDVGGGGFSRAKTMDVPSNTTNKLYQVCQDLFKVNYQGQVVRNVHVRMTNLLDDTTVQLDLFEDNTKEREVGYVMDAIQKKYGFKALFRARNLAPGATSMGRLNKIGGHRA